MFLRSTIFALLAVALFAFDGRAQDPGRALLPVSAQVAFVTGNSARPTAQEETEPQPQGIDRPAPAETGSRGGISFLQLLTRGGWFMACLLYTSPSPRDATLSRMPSSA